MDFLELAPPSTLMADFAGFSVPRVGTKHPERTLPSFELFFVRTGFLHMEENGRGFVVGKNETLILWPERRHKGLQEYGSDLTFYWIHFRLKPSTSPRPLRIPQHAKPARPECLSELFHRYLSDQESGILTAEEASCLVSLMLMEVRRTLEDHPAPNHLLAEKAKLFIEENFHRGIHPSEIAKAVGCNADYLGSVYRKAFGSTLNQAIHQKQIHEARNLLRDSSHNLDQIAHTCGFSDQRYFRRVFTALQGISPRAYRKLYSRKFVQSR